ncbi:MAG: family 1 encapsulin nanocompartment shell protein [Solirubrobacteraceae bacterium]|nr:MAG: bacteriocin [Solirubrobacterales bacterium]
MNHLLRELAPISDAGWSELDREARERLTAGLAARRLTDFSGPLGWDHSATNLGRVEPLSEPPVDGVSAIRRRVLPLVELCAEFQVARAELADLDRGALAPKLDELEAAARALARAENVAVFHGWEAAGVVGITEASPHPTVVRDDDFNRYPSHVAKAVELLLCEGIAGPYGLALGREDHTSVIETAEHGGYPLFQHLSEILGGPIVWAPGVRGAVVMSLRGGDFVLESGQDLSLGYTSHDTEAVHLYIEESFSFRVITAEAAVAVASAVDPS